MLPAVVLLVQDDPQAGLRWGAGVIVDAQGHVLTNQHVVAGPGALQALTWRADRVSYSPLDGGLRRTLFEHEREQVPATVEREDPSLDLALVKLDTDTSALAVAQPCTRPVAPGDRGRGAGSPPGRALVHHLRGRLRRTPGRDPA